MIRFPPHHARGLADTADDHMNDRRKLDVLRQLEPRAAFRDVPDEAGDRCAPSPGIKLEEAVVDAPARFGAAIDEEGLES